jgi:hypothetical protein
MIVLPKGNVGVGTATPARLHVEGSLSKTSGAFTFRIPIRRLPRRTGSATASSKRLPVAKTCTDSRSTRLKVKREPAPACILGASQRESTGLGRSGGTFRRASGAVDENLSELRIGCETAGRYNVLLIGTRADRLARDYFDPLGVEYQQTVMSGGEKTAP